MNSKVFDPPIPHLDSRSSSDAWNTRRNSLYEIRPFKNDKRKVEEKDGKFIGLKKYEK